MNIRQRHQMIDKMIATALQIVNGCMERCCQLFGQVGIYDFINLALDKRLFHAGLYQDVAVYTIGRPITTLTGPNFMERSDKTEMKMRLPGEILYYACNFAIFGIIQ